MKGRCQRGRVTVPPLRYQSDIIRGVDILIRNVPEPVQAKLAERAALAGKSVSAYLRELLAEHASAVTVDEWLGQVEALAPARGRKAGAAWVAEARAEADGRR